MHLSTQNLFHLNVTGDTNHHKFTKHITNNHKEQIHALLKVKAAAEIPVPVYLQFKLWAAS